MKEVYINALIGGSLIGLMALLFSGGIGRVMGVSGIIKGILPKAEKNNLWRWLFLIGMSIGGIIYIFIKPEYQIFNSNSSIFIGIISGILVGVGTSMANGCASGHAVCGIGRLSIRSIVSTILFVISGMITVYILKLI